MGDRVVTLDAGVYVFEEMRLGEAYLSRLDHVLLCLA